jgi:tRNA(His) 5'-end guanylyltransferase
MEIQELGDRMKSYESKFNNTLDNTMPVVLRFDGHGFSKFTQKLNKPFDDNFSQAMKETAIDVLKYFNANIAYCQSDEITIVIMPKINETTNTYNELMFSGRIEKLVSLGSSYTSVCFMKHIMQLVDNDYINKKMPHFDGRTFNLPDTSEVINNLIWRCRDAKRNSKNTFSRQYFSTKQLMNKTSDEMIQMVKEQHNIDWNQLSEHIKYGTIFKQDGSSLNIDIHHDINLF